MKIAVIDDYQGAFSTTKAYPKLKAHDVVIYNQTEKDPAKLGARLRTRVRGGQADQCGEPGGLKYQTAKRRA